VARTGNCIHSRWYPSRRPTDYPAHGPWHAGASKPAMPSNRSGQRGRRPTDTGRPIEAFDDFSRRSPMAAFGGFGNAGTAPGSTSPKEKTESR
jgi:hypothetical protein